MCGETESFPVPCTNEARAKSRRANINGWAATKSAGARLFQQQRDESRRGASREHANLLIVSKIVASRRRKIPAAATAGALLPLDGAQSYNADRTLPLKAELIYCSQTLTYLSLASNRKRCVGVSRNVINDYGAIKNPN